VRLAGYEAGEMEVERCGASVMSCFLCRRARASADAWRATNSRVHRCKLRCNSHHIHRLLAAALCVLSCFRSHMSLKSPGFITNNISAFVGSSIKSKASTTSCARHVCA
jgi:hypothetical protein